ncbi:MAG: 5,6-dimethylbenzimidazole synthase [Nitrospinae bacterium]|nr:5,6-dimethylbenzimidazole synthase [Nitrospinota bacterium]
MNYEFPAEWREGVYQAIVQRRDIRHFLPDAVPTEKLAKILKAGHHSASVGFMQPWDFIIIEDVEVRRKVKAHVEAERLIAAEGFDGERREKYLAYKLEGILEAPINICVTCDRERTGGKVLGRNTIRDTDVYSTAGAVQNMWLAARAEGIGVGWVSILQPEFLNNLLGLPENVTPVAYLCVGYAKEFPERPVLETTGWLPRLSLEKIVHSNRWGAPSPQKLADELRQDRIPHKDFKNG